jgi:hypothetical protein
LTSTTIGNDDVADLATVSTFLKEHSRNDTSGFLGQSTIIRSLADHEFFSPTLSTAIAGTLFGLDTYRLQTLSMNVFFFFSVLLFYALAESVFRYSPWDAVVASGIYAVSPVMTYVVLQGYQGQVMGSAVAIALFILLLNSLEVTSGCEIAAYLPFLVLTTWALSMSYPHMLIFTYLVPITYAVAIRVLKGRKVSAWAALICSSIVALIVLSPGRAWQLIRQVIIKGNSNNGWFIPWDFSIFGMEMHSYIEYAALLLLASFVLGGIVKRFQTDEPSTLLALTTLAFCAGGFAILAIAGATAKAGYGGYKSFKFLSFYWPMFLASSLLLLSRTDLLARRTRVFVYTATIMIVAVHAVPANRRLLHWSRAVTPEMAGIAAARDYPYVTSVNILGRDWWEILWATDFLLDKKLYYETSTYEGRFAGALKGDWDLVHSVDTVAGDNPCLIPLNRNYMLKLRSRAAPELHGCTAAVGSARTE